MSQSVSQCGAIVLLSFATNCGMIDLSRYHAIVLIIHGAGSTTGSICNVSCIQ